MPCEDRFPDGPPPTGPPLGSPESPWPAEWMAAGIDGACSSCGADDLRPEGAIIDRPDDGAPLRVHVEHPTEVDAWLRCGACGELDHRRGRSGGVIEGGPR